MKWLPEDVQLVLYLDKDQFCFVYAKDGAMWLFEIKLIQHIVWTYSFSHYLCLKCAQLCPFIALPHPRSSMYSGVYLQLMVPQSSIILRYDNFHKASVAMAKAGIMLYNASSHGSCVAPPRQHKSQCNKMVSCCPRAAWSWGQTPFHIAHGLSHVNSDGAQSHQNRCYFI